MRVSKGKGGEVMKVKTNVRAGWTKRVWKLGTGENR